MGAPRIGHLGKIFLCRFVPLYQQRVAICGTVIGFLGFAALRMHAQQPTAASL
jgi:hypothetical protein